jgi:ubiquinone/menaquinone biosynthesis C-methylase UbiE/predicted transcriptional regulator
MNGITSNTLYDSAQNLAGKSILIEIGSKIGVLDLLTRESGVTLNELQKKTNIKMEFLDSYLNSLNKLDLLHIDSSGKYIITGEMLTAMNNCGYLLWALQSCSPLIENSREFANNLDNAMKKYHRNGEHVARTSKWMGSRDFYPNAEKEILKSNPNKVLDLGSGTCALLINLMSKLPQAIGIGVDLSASACEHAKQNIRASNMESRIEVINSPLEYLILDSEKLKNVDIIHAGFVFHDLQPLKSNTLHEFLNKAKNESPNLKLVVTDAVYYDEPWNKNAYSIAFSFLHEHFMDRKLPTEDEWVSVIKKAGFKDIHIEKPILSGSRLIVAS